MIRLRQKTELILGAFLLLTISCDCKPRPLGIGEDNWGATLTTSAAKILGSVNNNPVIEVDGEIQENSSKETILGVLYIPDGYSIQDAADELRENKEAKNPDTEIALPESKGFAYYAKDLKAEYTGKESITTYSEKGTLQKNTTYMAHLVLGGKDVCFSPAGKPFNFKTPTTTGPQVQMVSAGAKKKITGTGEQIELDLKSQVNSVVSNSQGGFLLIEQGNTAVSPTKLIAALIKQQKSLPTGSGFQQLDGRQDALIYPHATSITGSYTVSEIEVPDATNLLKRGATYQVYCYVVDKANNYTISQEDQTITIPKPVVKLAMKEAGIEELVNAPNIGINTLQLALKGDITQHEGTVNPTVGFLFATANLDKSAAIVQIEQLLSKGGTLGSFADDGTTIIYRANSVATGTKGTQEFLQADASSLLPRMLGKNYTVYFWLKDGSGEVFVSDNSTELRIPNVDLSITDVTSLKTKSSALTIIIDTQVKNETNLNDSKQQGFLFLPSGRTITEAMLKEILKGCECIDQAVYSSLEGMLEHFAGSLDGIIYRKGGSTFSDSDYNFFQEKSKYDVYFWRRDNNAIFCVANAPTPPQITTYSKDKKDEAPAKVKYKGTTYEIYTNRVKRVKWLTPTTRNTEQLTKAKDRDLLKKVLGEHLKKNEKADNEQIEEFLDQMPG